MSKRYRGPKLKMRGRIWYAWILGRLVSTGCTDRTAAEAVALELERVAADPQRAAQEAVTLERACREYLKALDTLVKAKKRAHETYKMRDVHVGHLCRVLGRETPVASIDYASFETYATQRVEEGACAATVFKELSALLQVLKRSNRKGWWSGEFKTLMPDGFSGQSEPGDAWATQENLSKLLAKLPQDRARHCAWIVATASDWGSSVQARAEDVDWEGGTVLVRGTKTRYRRRRVPILSRFRSLLEFATAGAPSEGLMFRSWASVRRDMADACSRAKVPKVTPRDLRRTSATWLRADGVEPQLIGGVLGHKDSRMVERVYGKLWPERLGELIEAKLANRPNTDQQPLTFENDGTKTGLKIHVSTVRFCPWTPTPRGG